jgi:hypothetical protein
VPQGGILSPTLYNEHVRTLAQRIDALPAAQLTTRVHISDNLQLSLLLYADDLSTLTKTREDAVKCYRLAALPWSVDTASKLNHAKTEFMQLTMPGSKVSKQPLKLDDQTAIVPSTTLRLLGVHFHPTDPNTSTH